jgi:hypothetical protein
MKGSFSEESLRRFTELAAQAQPAEFSERDTYDFTRCVRPDGSFYGTDGRCRKGTEVGYDGWQHGKEPGLERVRATSTGQSTVSLQTITWGKIRV